MANHTGGKDRRRQQAAQGQPPFKDVMAGRQHDVAHKVQRRVDGLGRHKRDQRSQHAAAEVEVLGLPANPGAGTGASGRAARQMQGR